MISQIGKNIIIRALEIRKKQGESPEEVLEGYKNLTEEEKGSILSEIEGGRNG